MQRHQAPVAQPIGREAVGLPLAQEVGADELAVVGFVARRAGEVELTVARDSRVSLPLSNQGAIGPSVCRATGMPRDWCLTKAVMSVSSPDRISKARPPSDRCGTC